MATPSLIAELEDAVSCGCPEKRVETLRRITSLFLDQAERLNEQQVGVFDDVLGHLVERIESHALVQLSASLAGVDNAPVEVVRRLSRHDEIAVAGPVLGGSGRLSDHDLIEIACAKGQGHLLAISGRASLAAGVTDVLVARGDRQVCRTLATNAGARFSDSGFASLVKKADGDEQLAENLGGRLDLPAPLLRRLMVTATDRVRARLLASAPPERQAKIQEALASAAGAIARGAAGALDLVQSESLVNELNRQGKLNETVLAGFIKQHQQSEMIATLALFCGAKPALIERLFDNPRQEGLIVAAKAARLSWPTVALMLQAWCSHHAVASDDLAAAARSFAELSPAAAQRSMRFMQVHTVAKAS